MSQTCEVTGTPCLYKVDAGEAFIPDEYSAEVSIGLTFHYNLFSAGGDNPTFGNFKANEDGISNSGGDIPAVSGVNGWVVSQQIPRWRGFVIRASFILNVSKKMLTLEA